MATLKDSGERTHYTTGAVRDCKEGKGRFDLMPMDTVYSLTGVSFYRDIYNYKTKGTVYYLADAFKDAFTDFNYETIYDVLLELAKHFEDGAEKYGENNWQKGIPVHSYIDSAIRHYTKYMAGMRDEPHDRACLWNLLCCIWTINHSPEMNDYANVTIEL